MGEYCTLIKTCVQIMPWISNVISMHVRWGIRQVDTAPLQLPTPAVSLISNCCVFLQVLPIKTVRWVLLGLFRSIALGKASKFSDVVLNAKYGTVSTSDIATKLIVMWFSKYNVTGTHSDTSCPCFGVTLEKPKVRKRSEEAKRRKTQEREEDLSVIHMC